jgi:DNA-binding response OmpR family regulator
MAKRVLIVEDDPKIRQLLQRILETDYEVLTADNGQEAVRLAKAMRPGLVLLDIGLPNLDGMNALRLLKMSAETADIPVVIESAHGESGSLLDAQALGAIDFLIKPYTLDDVQDMVRRYLVVWKDPGPGGGFA